VLHVPHPIMFPFTSFLILSRMDQM
jgi:hypothetical protein